MSKSNINTIVLAASLVTCIYSNESSTEETTLRPKPDFPDLKVIPDTAVHHEVFPIKLIPKNDSTDFKNWDILSRFFKEIVNTQDEAKILVGNITCEYYDSKKSFLRKYGEDFSSLFSDNKINLRDLALKKNIIEICNLESLAETYTNVYKALDSRNCDSALASSILLNDTFLSYDIIDSTSCNFSNEIRYDKKQFVLSKSHKNSLDELAALYMLYDSNNFEEWIEQCKSEEKGSSLYKSAKCLYRASKNCTDDNCNIYSPESYGMSSKEVIDLYDELKVEGVPSPDVYCFIKTLAINSTYVSGAELSINYSSCDINKT